MNWIIESFGLKRYGAAILNVVSTVGLVIPGAGAVVAILQTIAAAFGVTGIVHATASVATESETAKLVTPPNPFSTLNISAVLAVLIATANSIPSWHVAVPILEALAGVFGAVAVSKGTVAAKS